MMLKPYMLYSRAGGAAEVAMLAFAHSWREARNIGWRQVGIDLTDEFTDFTAALMRNAEFIFREADPVKFAKDEAHVIVAPASCKRCEHWGFELDGNGLCELCAEMASEGGGG